MLIELTDRFIRTENITVTQVGRNNGSPVLHVSFIDHSTTILSGDNAAKLLQALKAEAGTAPSEAPRPAYEPKRYVHVTGVRPPASTRAAGVNLCEGTVGEMELRLTTADDVQLFRDFVQDDADVGEYCVLTNSVIFRLS